jgi:general stress protein 26
MDQTSQAQKAYDVLKDFSTAMFVTLGNGGRLSAKPMHVAQLDEASGEMWFLTSEHGALAEDLERDSTVLLVFQNDTSAYASVRGRAHIMRNNAKIKELWKEPYKVWFPRGPEDPEIALVGVDLVEAEYWDNRGANKLQYLFESAKAYMQGRKPENIDADQHATTTL